MIRILGALAPFSKWWPQELGLWSPPSSVSPREMGRGQLGVDAGWRLEVVWVLMKRVSGVPEEPSDLLPSPVTPLDVVKVRLQSQRPSVASGEYLNLEPD